MRTSRTRFRGGPISAAVDQDWRSIEPLELTPILRGALDSFHERGYHGATVRDIASRVGVTVPALYYHHKNKQGMLVALLDVSITDVARRIDVALADAGDDDRKRFAYLIEALILHMTGRVDFAFLDAQVRYLEPENRNAYAEARRKVEHRLVEVIDAGLDSGVFQATNARATARALVGMCQSVANWFHPDGPEKPHQIAAEYVDIALGAVRAKA